MMHSELGGRPRGNRVLDVSVAAAGVRHQLAVGVPAYECDAVAHGGQPVEYGNGLRSGRVVAGHHDVVGRRHGRLGEDRVEDGQDAMDIGQHGNTPHASNTPEARPGTAIGSALSRGSAPDVPDRSPTYALCLAPSKVKPRLARLASLAQWVFPRHRGKTQADPASARRV